jgi:protein TonB
MMTKNNTGKFFALKLCFMLPAIALPVALFGLSTAEITPSVIPTVASVETRIQAVDNVSKEPSVKSTVYTQDTKKDTAKTKKTDLTNKNVKKSKKEEAFLFGTVDVNPEYPGGQGEMMKFIFDNLKYPKEAAEKKIQGRVTVEFLVRTGGNVDNVKVLKSVDPLLDAEAVRVVKAMPAWTPGKHNGNTVAVRFFLPIVFQIPKDKEAETK